MYAIIVTGGKQLRVETDKLYKIELLTDKQIGDTVEFDQVLMLGDDKKVKVGQPLVAKAKVVAEVIDEIKLPKIRIIKHKRRKHNQKRLGHRQQQMLIKVTEIKTS